MDKRALKSMEDILDGMKKISEMEERGESVSQHQIEEIMIKAQGFEIILDIEDMVSDFFKILKHETEDLIIFSIVNYQTRHQFSANLQRSHLLQLRRAINKILGFNSGKVTSLEN